MILVIIPCDLDRDQNAYSGIGTNLEHGSFGGIRGFNSDLQRKG